jgi:hypothetical protein
MSGSKAIEEWNIVICPRGRRGISWLSRALVYATKNHHAGLLQPGFGVAVLMKPNEVEAMIQILSNPSVADLSEFENDLRRRVIRSIGERLVRQDRSPSRQYPCEVTTASMFPDYIVPIVESAEYAMKLLKALSLLPGVDLPVLVDPQRALLFLFDRQSSLALRDAMMEQDEFVTDEHFRAELIGDLQDWLLAFS